MYKASWRFLGLESWPKGTFSVKLAYCMLVTTKIRRKAWLEGHIDLSSTETEQRSWCKLWKIQVPSKIRVFLWRLAQQKIPSTDLLHHWNMATSKGCVLCGNEDSWRHSLMECTMSWCVWALEDEELVTAISETTGARCASMDFHGNGEAPWSGLHQGTCHAMGYMAR